MEFPNQDPFFNINTKEDLEQAKELLKKWLVTINLRKF
jgi:GTP:adenosylcobinamide-phosphate guanylyltransferase